MSLAHSFTVENPRHLARRAQARGIAAATGRSSAGVLLAHKEALFSDLIRRWRDLVQRLLWRAAVWPHGLPRARSAAWSGL